MSKERHHGPILAVWLCMLLGAHAQGPVIDLSAVALQPGFRISLYTSATLPAARSLALSGASKAEGQVITYVSTNSKGYGRVYALVDRSGTGANVSVVTLLSGLDTPCGIAWHNGSLYISHFVGSETDGSGSGRGGTGAISRLDNVDSYALRGQEYTGDLKLVTDELPAERSHALHYLRISPDGRQLYVPQGIPCNICVPERLPGVAQYATLMTLDLATNNLTVFATGIRNSVGFDWHPTSGVLYFTDNGRDEMNSDGGDNNNRPDCELNAAPRAGLFFGYPYCQARGEGNPYLRDPGSSPAAFWNDPDVNRNGSVLNCSDPSSHVRPVQALGPHVAPLGMRFYRRNATATSAFPEKYDRAAFIALHGSWNRDLLNGYKVVVVRLDGSGRAIAYEDFASFLRNQGTASNEEIGRPADVQQLPDGSLLVTDDGSNGVYRITYGDRAQGSTAAVRSSQAESAAARPADGTSAAGGAGEYLGLAWKLAATALLAAAVVLV